MRVAYLMPPLSQPGGWRTYAIGFVGAIARRVTPLLLVAREDEAAAARLFPDCERIVLPAVQYPFQSGLRQSLARLAAALAAVRFGRFPDVDLVHSLEAYPAGLIGDRLAARLGRPHVVTAHGTYGVLAAKSRAHTALYQGVLRRARVLCPVSPFTGELIRQTFPRAAARLAIRPILNGNDFYRTVGREEALCRQPDETPTVLSVGAIKPRKGYHVSLAAFAHLKRRLPEARYWIVGALDQRRYVDELRASAAEGVVWLGKASDEQLHDCYRRAAVFLLAPQQVGLHFEGFGLVYLEAGAYGLPVVGTASGGVPSAIRHAETGLVVAPQDTEGLADALYRLLGDRELAREMGLANRRWAETLTWEKNAGEHAALYREILTEKPS
ncbi:MAG TPA: glycosyltransferase family 4 protein [Anaerolineaceae bacterium]|nr:glycosyltransferase family 4 protein [Anaerolineaceae bacterium]